MNMSSITAHTITLRDEQGYTPEHQGFLKGFG